VDEGDIEIVRLLVDECLEGKADAQVSQRSDFQSDCGLTSVAVGPQ